MSKYKIKDLETLTGIKAHTIRIWEKRYNIIEPKRTDTKIRTYSDEELKLLLNVAILNENGIKISKIADLSSQQIREQVDKVSFSSQSNSIVVNLLIKALTTIDQALFNRVIDGCINKEGLKRTYINYIIPFLDRIGVMWLVGSINPAQEHFISNLIRQKLIVSIDKLPDSSRSNVDYILFCKDDEWHELGLLFYHYCLKEQGFNVCYFGQNVPFDSLLASKKQVSPSLGYVTSMISPIQKEELDAYLKRFEKNISAPLYIGGAQFSAINLKAYSSIKSVESIIDFGDD